MNLENFIDYRLCELMVGFQIEREYVLEEGFCFILRLS